MFCVMSPRYSGSERGVLRREMNDLRLRLFAFAPPSIIDHAAAYKSSADYAERQSVYYSGAYTAAYASAAREQTIIQDNTVLAQ